MEFKTIMMEHQQKAVEKLGRLKISALYSEPGTGKTRMVLEMAVARLRKGKIEKVLWFCPCSLKKSLAFELKKHITDTSFIEICGIETLSSSWRTYEQLMHLVQSEKVYLVVDESNLVKNIDAIRTQRILELSKHCPYRSILNGTPVSRNEADLFAQWYILDWRVLGYKSYYTFARNHLEYDEYGKVRRVLETEYLTKKIAPYTYQIRLSECVELPEKSSYNSYFYLTDEQIEHMADVADALLFHVNEYKPETIYRFLTGLQLVSCGYRLQLEQTDRKTDDGKVIQKISIHKKKRFFENPYDNPRIQRLLELVEDYEYDEKIILYAKYSDEITEIIQVLNETYGDGAAVRFDGSVSLKKRDANLDAFRENTRFLVANKTCAGYGLNLQFAHVIIFFSNDWDWATREQAEHRVHRMGQEQDVEIVDMIARSTVDERISRNLSRKTNLVEDLKSEIQKWKDDKSLKSLDEWLQEGEKERREMQIAGNKRERKRREKIFKNRVG